MTGAAVPLVGPDPTRIAITFGISGDGPACLDTVANATLKSGFSVAQGVTQSLGPVTLDAGIVGTLVQLAWYGIGPAGDFITVWETIVLP